MNSAREWAPRSGLTADRFVPMTCFADLYRSFQRLHLAIQTRSSTTAMPCPTPMHIVHKA